MLSAPASIPPTTQPTFAPAFGESTERCSAIRPLRPAEPAKWTIGTRPSVPTSFGSSKTGVIM